MTEDNNKIHLPKIKKSDLKSKIMLDPADFRKGLPKNKLPQLNDKALKAPLAKMNDQGTLKINIVYHAQVLQLIGRYVEVRVIDEYEHTWIGILFGINVRGTGGAGKIRGCRVKKIEGETIVVEAVNEGGIELWEKLAKKVEKILSEST